MALTRAFEPQEVPADIRRIYDEVREAFDLPFVPTIFQLSAAVPAYLQTMWRDLSPVVRSKEFHTAGQGLEEYVRSVVIQSGWRFHDQQETLAAHKFSKADVEMLGMVINVFTHSLPRLALFARLMQRGYSGGQRGRVSGARQANATSRMITLHVPSEREAALRVWLIYADIRRHSGARNIPSFFRVLSAYPGYLNSVWQDTRKLFNDPGFLRARDDAAKRVGSYVVGMPVRDHRALSRQVTAAQWRDIEETVDGFARAIPQFALALAVWHRSFPLFTGRFQAA